MAPPPFLCAQSWVHEPQCGALDSWWGVVVRFCPEYGGQWGKVEYGGAKWRRVKGVGAVFLGTYTPKLDDKGRFFLPAKFRDQLADGLVITRQQDHCLAIWPTETFMTEVAQAAIGPSTVRGVRDYQRMVASGASDELPDSQGRVGIPLPLRTYAGLAKDIVVIGAINRLEVWDAAAWAKYSAEQEEAFAALDEAGLTTEQPR